MAGMITARTPVEEALSILRDQEGFFLTNNERDVSQSDFRSRIMPQTTLKAAPLRDQVGYFSFEVTGGASVHMDLLKKQISPFDKLRVIKAAMPDTPIQAVCRGANLFGYRHYPEEVQRFVVSKFAKYVEVWRVYDFLNCVPNMEVVFEEVKKAGKILQPAICYSTGPEHTVDWYVKKAEEIVEITGEDIILCLKNHSGLGTPQGIHDLVKSIIERFPGLIVSYHGHNTDGNDTARAYMAIMGGAKICDVGDHGMSGFYGPPPALTVAQTLREYGKDSPGLNFKALAETSEVLRHQRTFYAHLESPYRCHDPTVASYKLTGGAMSSVFEQAEKGGFADRIDEIFTEFAKVHVELGNFWAVTPGSQILWTTAVANVLEGDRYKRVSNDLKDLLRGRYGPLPFYRPEEWIYEKVLGDTSPEEMSWRELNAKSATKSSPAEDIEGRRKFLEREMKRKASDEELALYLMFPFDTINYLKFEERYGRVWLLPPSAWFKRGGFAQGEKIEFADLNGKNHTIEIVSTAKMEREVVTSLLVDHQFQAIGCKLE